MQQTSIAKPEIKLVGISVRSSFQQELDKMKGNIFSCIRQYSHRSLLEKPILISSVKEVNSYDVPLPEGFLKLTIPYQNYAKFTPKSCSGNKYGKCRR